MMGLILFNFYIIYERKTNKKFFSSKALFYMKPLAIIFLVLFLFASSIIGMFIMIETNTSNFQYIESVNIDVGAPRTHYEYGMSWGEYRDIDIDVEVINKLQSNDRYENRFDLEIRFYGSGFYQRRSFFTEGETTTFHLDAKTYDTSKITEVSIKLYKWKTGSLIQSMNIDADIGTTEGGTISAAGGKPDLSSGYLFMILVIMIIQLLVFSIPQFIMKSPHN
jgi:hypothetical protein